MSQNNSNGRQRLQGFLGTLFVLLCAGLLMYGPQNALADGKKLMRVTLAHVFGTGTPLHDFVPSLPRRMTHVPGMMRELKSHAEVKASPAPIVRHGAIPAVMSQDEEDAARTVFARIDEGELPAAESEMADLPHHPLLSYMQAALYLHPRYTGLSYGALHAWLSAYADQPLAAALYAKAASLRGEGGASLPRPRWKQGLSGNIESASGAIPAEWKKTRMLAVAAALHEKERTEAESKDGDDEDIAVSQTDTQTIDLQKAEDFVRKGDVASASSLLNPLKKQGHADAESAYGFWLNGLLAFSRGEHEQAFEDFSAAASVNSLSASTRAGAAFWAARAAFDMGRQGEARDFLEMAAAVPRSFYGLLAQARLGRSVSYNWTVPALKPAHIAALKAHPAGLRALALLQMGRGQWAERELRGLHPKGDDTLEEALLAIADAAKLPALSLQVAGALTRNGKAYDGALYPLMGGLNAVQSNAALVLAVARQESRFDAGIKSPRGATGLMQIMPDTAEKLQAGSAVRLTDADFNLRLGDGYISKLSKMKGIDGQLVYTLAAYNCGPGRLMELAARQGLHGGDPLLFIETLPIKETRQYIQKVLVNFWAYQARLGQASTSLRSLAMGETPRMDAATPRVASKN